MAAGRIRAKCNRKGAANRMEMAVGFIVLHRFTGATDLNKSPVARAVGRAGRRRGPRNEEAILLPKPGGSPCNWRVLG